MKDADASMEKEKEAEDDEAWPGVQEPLHGSLLRARSLRKTHQSHLLLRRALVVLGVFMCFSVVVISVSAPLLTV